MTGQVLPFPRRYLIMINCEYVVNVLNVFNDYNTILVNDIYINKTQFLYIWRRNHIADCSNTFWTRTDPILTNHVAKILNALLSELAFGSVEFQPNFLNSVQPTVWTLVMLSSSVDCHHTITSSIIASSQSMSARIYDISRWNISEVEVIRKATRWNQFLPISVPNVDKWQLSRSSGIWWKPLLASSLELAVALRNFGAISSKLESI